jgi:hypothetical protein
MSVPPPPIAVAAPIDAVVKTPIGDVFARPLPTAEPIPDASDIPVIATLERPRAIAVPICAIDATPEGVAVPGDVLVLAGPLPSGLAPSEYFPNVIPANHQ